LRRFALNRVDEAFAGCFFGSNFSGLFDVAQVCEQNPVADIRELRFINEYILPNGIHLKNTVIGGLSGIDYDASRDLYYLVSDDPSSKGPTRYYSAEIKISARELIR
jgi:hypothetical protein